MINPTGEIMQTNQLPEYAQRIGLSDDQIAEIAVPEGVKCWNDESGVAMCEIPVHELVTRVREMLRLSSLHGYSTVIRDSEFECRRIADELPPDQRETTGGKLRLAGACIQRLLEVKKRRHEHNV